MRVGYDLHIHTALSPCGEERMTPQNIVNMARLAGLDMIAITDHNTCGNCRAVMKAGEGVGLAVVPGMELATAEEAHILCLFPTADAADAFEALVRPRRLFVANNTRAFGHQHYLNENDEVTGEEEGLLLTATDIGAYEVQGLCRGLGGFAVPAHIDRSSFSLLASLGYIDPAMGFPVCEVSLQGDKTALRAAHPELAGVAFLQNSDAHDLGYIGLGEGAMELDEAAPGALIEALAGHLAGRGSP